MFIWCIHKNNNVIDTYCLHTTASVNRQCNVVTISYSPLAQIAHHLCCYLVNLPFKVRWNEPLNVKSVLTLLLLWGRKKSVGKDTVEWTPLSEIPEQIDKVNIWRTFFKKGQILVNWSWSHSKILLIYWHISFHCFIWIHNSWN